MRKKLLSLSLFVLLVQGPLTVHPLFSQSRNANEKTISDIFLKKSNIWEGPFQNYINRNGGITQKGKIQIEIKYDGGQVVQMRNKFLDERNKQSDYTGYASMKILGNKLEYVGETSVDENTGNRIENHVFKGYILEKHLYIHEEYTEVFSEGKRENRKNTVHYLLLSDNEILQAADVYVNDGLMVFAYTILKKKD